MDAPRIFIIFTWIVIALFVVALAVAGSMLIQRRIKPRREYAGPALNAVQLAYLAGGRERAEQAASAATYAGRTQDAQSMPDVDGSIAAVHEAGLVDATGQPTPIGEAAVRDMRDQYAYLWPGYHPYWSDLDDGDLAMAVALFGESALNAIAPPPPRP